MKQRFEYLVCQSQAGKITIVNEDFAGKFLGDQADVEDREKMLESCPSFFDFLSRVGTYGWELVCGYNIVTEYGQYEKLIFKRPT
jgi:hypothetical protein